MSTRWFACLCLVCMLGVAGAQEPADDAGTAAASTEQPEAEDAATTGTEPQPEAKPVESPAQAAARSPDSFTPSEEISEDLSVSFPVDI